ncbi:DUF4214 domain-containing protein [Candidatus Thiosymbion oneisti]|uniref:DUF4214 domain-containing protein n=1 Tax=Candidatus Thiosymbion oneisti TaxID=589554 RepID=UPI001414EAFC|nr:DUF4214 domain-containing protein [Candidatus Thiosymbion oneisti]
MGFGPRGLAQCQSRTFDAYETAIIEIYIAYYGRPPDVGGLDYWAKRLEAEGNSLVSIIDAFGTSEEFEKRFGGMDNEQLVTNLYFQMFGRDPEPKGLAYYVSKLQSGTSSLPRISLDILYGARNEDRTVLDNRAAVAHDFVTRLERHRQGYTDAGLLLCHAQVEASDLGEICDAGERIIAAKPTVIDYRMSGLNVGPYVCPERNYRTGEVKYQDPADGRDMRMRAGQLDALLRVVAPHTRWVRTFGCTNGLNELARRAKTHGLKVALGAWIDRDLETNQQEIDCIIDAARNGWADRLVVGSEVLMHNDLPLDELVVLIERVKAETELPVSHGAVTFSYRGNSTLINAVDFVSAHIYPFWAREGIDGAMTLLDAAFRDLRSATGGKEVWIGETGWPSAGESLGAAVASQGNFSRHFQEFVSWARANAVNYLYFEAMDEPWKTPKQGTNGAHWGIWDKYGAMKPGIADVFSNP